MFCTTIAQAEILAFVNYETKPEQSVRKEGIAVIDVDPESKNFNKIIMEIPLPSDLVSHHIYFNRERTKAYITALGKSILHVMDMRRFPYKMNAIEMNDCNVLEDIVFSDDNMTWYLTCMGSNNVIIGDAVTDGIIKVVSGSARYAYIRHPHGISVHTGIDRLLVTSTVRPSDMGEHGETVTVIEASTGKVISTHKVSNKESPSGATPVEVMFFKPADPPIAYITNMFEGSLWMAIWNPATKGFSFKQVDDFAFRGQGVALEMDHNPKGDRLYVTTAKPGHLNIYDISDPMNPKFLKAIPTAQGAHHMAISPDERYIFVQNNLLNLPELNDGSITVIDLETGVALKSVDVLKKQGLNPNCIVLLP
ncbi:MAG: YncE family protein [Nitrospinae bacterium]|nr:YncE family protein [Nitrospinota bacterium]